MFITESWCDNSVTNALLVGDCDYQVFRRDRVGKVGGGVLIFAKKELKIVQVEIPEQLSSLETIVLDCVGAANCRVRICCVYRTNDPCLSVLQECSRTSLLADLMSFCCGVAYPACVVGDFNFPSIDWGLLSVSNADPNQEIFLEACIDNSLTQLVSFPTHIAGNILDLVLSNDNCLVLDVSESEPFTENSDHCSVEFTLDFEKGCQAGSQAKYFRNFKKANYAAINDYLSQVAWNNLVVSAATPDQLYTEINKICTECIERFVPRCKVRTRKRNYPPALKRLIRRKRKLFDFSKRSKIGKDLYKKCAKTYEESVREFHDVTEAGIVNSANVKSFYNYANSKLKNRQDIAPLKRTDGSLATKNSEKAQILLDQFSSVFTDDDNQTPNFERQVPEEIGLNSAAFPVDLVLKKLRKLPPKCSKTPDGIPAIFLKNVAENVAFPLAKLFEWSMSTGQMPDLWKEAIVVPIFKKGLASRASNYRPISLLSIAGKVMESIIADAMLKFLYDHNLISKDQFGFLSKRSTGLQLLSCLNDWTRAVRDKHPVDVVYIDYAKAFDTVCHEKLLIKLRAYGFGYELLNWLKEYLANRRQRVCVDDSFSDYSFVKSGVPQGGSLSPLLFLIYINDLPAYVGDSATTRMFADDTKIYCVFDNNDSPDLFRESLRRFCEWSRTWQLSVAFNKCSVLSLGYNNQRNDYHFENILLENVDSVVDLGIVISRDLKSSQYCRLISARALARCAVMFRAFKTTNKDILLKAYTTYVRPLVEYETSVWSPYLKGDIRAVERVQRTFTRRLFERCNLPRAEYRDRLSHLGLETLESRRVKFDLINTFKIIRGHVGVDRDEFFTFSNNTKTRGHSAKLAKEKGRIDARLNFFCVRVVNWWNKLSEHVVSARSVHSFKQRLDLVNFDSIITNLVF